MPRAVTDAPAFDCKAHFGELCADSGLSVLSHADIRLAKRSGLKVFVYLDVPPGYHRALWTRHKSLVAEVASGSVCDFVRRPCTPPDPPENEPGYSKGLNEWLTGAKHAADVPLLAKLLALGATPGIHTSDPRKAHLFVVPFLGGFIERVSPQMSNVLDREQRSTGRGVVDKLIDHLPHFANSTSKRHLFLFTNSCGGCLRQPCHRCASWQNTHLNRDAGVELAATLGPTWPVEKIAPHVRPPVGRKWIKQLIIPPNVMEAELHPPLYKPLCMPGTDAASAAGPCRPNTAKKELLAFYQGAHSFNGIRVAVLSELSRVVFGPPSPPPPPGIKAAEIDCRSKPMSCVNTSNGVAFFYSGSHWHPVTPLGFGATIEWMRKSKFCICPPGDVPYNKRYFTALLVGCVPVVFSFRSQIPDERNWWKPKKGPGQRDIDPFYEQINHSELAVEMNVDVEKDVIGMYDRLRDIPDHVVEAKQRAIERVRHLLLYDLSGSKPDAFTCMLRQVIGMLAAMPQEEGRAALVPPEPFKA